MAAEQIATASGLTVKGYISNKTGTAGLVINVKLDHKNVNQQQDMDENFRRVAMEALSKVEPMLSKKFKEAVLLCEVYEMPVLHGYMKELTGLNFRIIRLFEKGMKIRQLKQPLSQANNLGEGGQPR